MTALAAGCLRLLVLGAVLAFVAGIPVSRDQKATCGYESCPKPKPNMLNVHLIPHSHDDVGWLKTVDQLYYGSNSREQKTEGAQYIIESVVTELQKDPTKRFIQVETAYFAKWWKEQDESTRDLVKSLVQNGRLEFVGGGWCMNDEALTTYQAITDQFTLGYRFLNDTFGACGRPRVAWQIDPFGHSRGFALIAAELGLDGVFLHRINIEDREIRMKAKTAEMLWKTSPNLGAKTDLFASILYGSYDAPSGFCFDVNCGDEPIIDDKESPDYNVESKLAEFTQYVEKQAASYTTGNILITMGGDYQYSSARHWYKNLDKLIKYLNARQSSGGKINAFYSTPSCYIKALNDVNATWTTKEDDFLPHAVHAHAYFTGFFTSRPTQKFMERIGNNFLQVVKQLATTASLSPKQSQNITILKEAMGIIQHHDAITGTERQHVADDYARMMTKGYYRADGPAAEALRKLTKSPTEFKSCFTLNISQCDITENKQRFVVTVYNPLGQRENTYVRLPVPQGVYKVRDAKGKEQKTQLLPIPFAVTQIPGRQSKAINELVFYAQQLPPLGFRSYFVERVGNGSPKDYSTTVPVQNAFAIQFGSSAGAEIDSKTGLLKQITGDGVNFTVRQDFMYWLGTSGGAWIFQPNADDAKPVSQSVLSKVFKGDLVQEIHQTYSDYMSQVIRIYANENHVELVYQVGPLPIDDGKNKEVISRLQTELKTEGLFYTDANGREAIQRKRDFRPTWPIKVQEKASGNYYPVPTRISIRDAKKKQRLSVLPDRGSGGTSFKDGQVELMIHRRLLVNEGYLNGALNETAYGKGLVSRGTHLVFCGDEAPKGKPTLAAQEVLGVRRNLLRSWLFFSDASSITFEQWQKGYVSEFSGLTDPLPTNVHLLTLEQVTETKLIVRLEHPFEKNDDPELSKPATVDLRNVLKPFKVVRAQETTLAGNQWLSESNRLTWRTNSGKSNDAKRSTSNRDDFSVTLNPLEIRTFIVDIGN